MWLPLPQALSQSNQLWMSTSGAYWRKGKAPRKRLTTTPIRPMPLKIEGVNQVSYGSSIYEAISDLNMVSEIQQSLLTISVMKIKINIQHMAKFCQKLQYTQHSIIDVTKPRCFIPFPTNTTTPVILMNKEH